MKKYIWFGFLSVFMASLSWAQFGDILEDVVKGKVREKTGLTSWSFQTCQITDNSQFRMPASANVARHIAYDHQSGAWQVFAKCKDGVYKLKANSYEDAKNLAQLLRNGSLKAGYHQSAFKGFFVSE